MGGKHSKETEKENEREGPIEHAPKHSKMEIQHVLTEAKEVED